LLEIRDAPGPYLGEPAARMKSCDVQDDASTVMEVNL
jgi:hypothetical protein